MKKLTLLIVVGFALFFTACRKNRTCTCDSTTVTTGPAGSSTVTSSSTKNLINVTKSEGRVNCLSIKYQFEETVSGDTYLYDIEKVCTLK